MALHALDLDDAEWSSDDLGDELELSLPDSSLHDSKHFSPRDRPDPKQGSSASPGARCPVPGASRSATVAPSAPIPSLSSAPVPVSLFSIGNRTASHVTPLISASAAPAPAPAHGTAALVSSTARPLPRGSTSFCIDHISSCSSGDEAASPGMARGTAAVHQAETRKAAARSAEGGPPAQRPPRSPAVARTEALRKPAGARGFDQLPDDDELDYDALLADDSMGDSMSYS